MKLHPKDLTSAQVDEKTAKHRQKIHADHLQYFYGDHWCVFIDQKNKCFLDFDIGHFASEFITREITRADYDALIADKSLFNEISGKLR